MKENLKEKILDILSTNCMYTPEEIAVMLGADASLVIAAIQQFEEDKIILGKGCFRQCCGSY